MTHDVQYWGSTPHYFCRPFRLGVRGKITVRHHRAWSPLGAADNRTGEGGVPTAPPDMVLSSKTKRCSDRSETMMPPNETRQLKWPEAEYVLQLCMAGAYSQTLRPKARSRHPPRSKLQTELPVNPCVMLHFERAPSPKSQSQ